MSDDGDPQPDQPSDEAELIGTWFHSFEEDEQEDVRTYRPATYDFPPTRMPRLSIRLDADGTANDGTPGPDDRTQETPGRWTVADGFLTTVVAGRSETFLIETQDDRVLALRVEPRERNHNFHGGKEEE